MSRNHGRVNRGRIRFEQTPHHAGVHQDQNKKHASKSERHETHAQLAEFKVAWDRAETEPCQRNTPGCCVDHPCDGSDSPCATW